jgi:Putative DNA-binding domain
MKTPIEHSVPYTLQTTQEWFAQTITRRLDKKNHIQRRTSSGILIAEEAARYVVPSPTLRSEQRMQIYNQQYWWRLLNTLHTNFPLVTRLFGYQAFNEEIGIPYLIKFPPDHWSLTRMGERLPQWIQSHYLKPDQQLIFHAATLDWAFAASFIASQHALLDPTILTSMPPEQLLSQTFYLQPHVYLLQWDYDLLSFREAFLKQEVDYWLHHRFPVLKKEIDSIYILYRTPQYQIAWRPVSLEELKFLSLFKNGIHLAAACEWIEKQEPKLQETVASHLQKWLQEWIQSSWLTVEKI